MRAPLYRARPQFANMRPGQLKKQHLQKVWPYGQQLLAMKPNFSGYIALAVGITYFGAKTVRENSKIYSSNGLSDFQTAAI